MKITILTWVPLSLAIAPFSHGTTLLHFRTSSADAATVGAGTVPGVDGSADGTVSFGAVSLSENIPANAPAGGGDRSLVFDGASGVNLPGTQQLLNSTLETSGGFTMEAWFSYSGGGNINSIIDYAGTEKIFRTAADPGAGYRNNSAAPVFDLGGTAGDEWHYTAVVFTPTSPVNGAGEITGDFTFYFDSNIPVSTSTDVTISAFGDSLNRTIGVGTHPVGFAGDFFNGNIYEPRVTLGALSASELLISSAVPEPGSTGLLFLACAFVGCRRRR